MFSYVSCVGLHLKSAWNNFECYKVQNYSALALYGLEALTVLLPHPRSPTLARASLHAAAEWANTCGTHTHTHTAPSTPEIHCQEIVSLFQALRIPLFCCFTMIPPEKCSLLWKTLPMGQTSAWKFVICCVHRKRDLCLKLLRRRGCMSIHCSFPFFPWVTW